MILVLAIILSYLLGSIPTAYIFGKWYKGIDIRKHGSGNVGATYVFRVLGKGPGIFVLCVDILKGVLAVSLVPNILGLPEVWVRIVLSLCVVAGHNWTIFLNFQGGKGIATSLGVLIGLTISIATIRPVLIWTILVWGISFFSFGYVSLASIIAAVSLPIIMVLTAQPLLIIFLGIIFSLFVVIRHRINIRRLLNGEESRAFKRSKKN